MYLILGSKQQIPLAHSNNNLTEVALCDFPLHFDDRGKPTEGPTISGPGKDPKAVDRKTIFFTWSRLGNTDGHR